MIANRLHVRISCILAVALLAGCGDAKKATTVDARAVPTADVPMPESCLSVHSAEDADPCRCSSDCQEGAVCLLEQPAITGGFCRRSCETSACPSGYTCTPGKQCAHNCSGTSDCGRSRVCDGGLCRPFCTQDSDCNAGVCNHWSGDCVASVDELHGFGLGVPCLIDGDCKSDLCSKSQGVCIASCSVSEQSCPEGAVCASDVADPKSDMGLCFAPCRADGSCERGSCIPLPAPPGALVCLPPANRGCLFEPRTAADGGPCGCDLDCVSGSCFDETNYGYPSGVCDHECQSSADCRQGLACSIYGFCTDECKTSDDCRSGFVCGPSRACQPLCQLDSDCANGTCDLYTGKCLAPREGGGIGAPCKTREDCRSTLCDTDSYAIGACMSICSTKLQVCPDGGVCRGTSSSGELGL